MTPQRNTPQSRKPKILVLEGIRAAATCVRLAGGEPFVVNPRNVKALDEALASGFDGLLLTGGGDVDPRLYGEKPHPKTYGVSEVRDYVEWSALDMARDEDLPVLGICRGMQLMTVHNGGRLKQHIGGSHRGISHAVVALRGTRFRRVIKRTSGVFVSLHHQRVLRTGDGWRVAGRDPNGGIEAVESRDGRCIGVQFHPEMDYHSNDESQHLFRWLVVESAKRAGLPIPRRPRPGSLLPRATGTPSVARRAALVPLDGFPPVERRVPKRPMASRWFCRQCGMEFSGSGAQQNRDDHEYWICGTPKMRTTEPPPGHPDWIDPDTRQEAK